PLAILPSVTAPLAILLSVTALPASLLSFTAPFLMFFVLTAFLPSFTAANAVPPTARQSASTATTIAGDGRGTLFCIFDSLVVEARSRERFGLVSNLSGGMDAVGEERRPSG